MSGLHRLSSIMEGFMKASGTRSKIKSYMVLDLWPQIIGSALAGQTEARTVKNGVLYITCVSPPVAHQLSFMKKGIQKKIDELVGAGVVKDIRFQAGEIDAACSGKARATKDNEADGTEADRALSQLAELDGQDMALLEGLRQSDTDPALQTAFLKAAITARRVRKTRLQQGWEPCRKCGVLFDPKSGSDLCPVCTQQETQQHVEEAAELLRLFPWKSYDELHREHQTLTEFEYQIARREKLQQLSQEINNIVIAIRRGAWAAAAGQAAQISPQELSKLRTLVLEYIMIYDGCLYQDLTSEKVSAVLGKNTAECLFS